MYKPLKSSFSPEKMDSKVERVRVFPNLRGRERKNCKLGLSYLFVYAGILFDKNSNDFLVEYKIDVHFF